MQITNTTLCCTDFNKNKMNRLCSLGNQKDWSIIGTYSEGLILQCSWLPSEHSSQNSDNQLSNLHYELQLYSLHDNCLIDTNFTWKQGELSLVINQDTIYYVKKAIYACMRIVCKPVRIWWSPTIYTDQIHLTLLVP